MRVKYLTRNILYTCVVYVPDLQTPTHYPPDQFVVPQYCAARCIRGATIHTVANVSTTCRSHRIVLVLHMPDAPLHRPMFVVLSYVLYRLCMLICTCMSCFMHLHHACMYACVYAHVCRHWTCTVRLSYVDVRCLLLWITQSLSVYDTVTTRCNTAVCAGIVGFVQVACDDDDYEADAAGSGTAHPPEPGAITSTSFPLISSS